MTQLIAECGLPQIDIDGLRAKITPSGYDRLSPVRLHSEIGQTMRDMLDFLDLMQGTAGLVTLLSRFTTSSEVPSVSIKLGENLYLSQPISKRLYFAVSILVGLGFVTLSECPMELLIAEGAPLPVMPTGNLSRILVYQTPHFCPVFITIKCQ